jgi:cystathionine beta-lyase
MFARIYQNFGIKFHFIDLNDLEKLKSLINGNTKLVWMETTLRKTKRLSW